MSMTPKQRAGAAALDFVQDGMTVGLGSGSTSAEFIRLLGEKVAKGLEIKGIPSSRASEALANQLSIPLIEPDETTVIDLYVDGADEVDPDASLIKGGGAALLREKIIASAAAQFLCVVDPSKMVTQLGAFPLPIEVERFGWALTVKKIRAVMADHGLAGAPLTLRPQEGGGFLMTDGQNYIVDAQCGRIADPAALDRDLTMVPGVVTTGIFVGLASKIIIGGENEAEIRDV